VIATLLIAALPEAHVRAAAITGSAWLAMDSSGAPTLAHLAREVGLDSLLLGYREATLFAPWAGDLTPMDRSLDAPFWSLHLELYGSLLVLCLVTLRAHSAWLHRTAVIVAAIAFGTHPLFLFVLGHLLSPPPLRGGGAWGSWGGLVLLLGLVLCATKDWQSVEWLRLTLSRTELAYAPDLYQFQSQLGAVALYVGVLWCPFVWPALSSGPCRRLGALSFSVYLLHFPILFTLVCFAFTFVPSVLAAFAVFVATTLLAALLFERWIDRPAIALSRHALLRTAVP
jgi:peptidoglycan/LPS O-acetylase OafA/YrhL